MQFNSDSAQLDLYSDARFLCGLDETSDTTSYPIKAFTRNANLALDKVISWMQKADNIWVSDDTNQTGELLDVSTNLVAGTVKYALSITWLKIGRVRIKDPTGNWITIQNLARKAIDDTTLTEANGTPRAYFLLGNYLYLTPATSYVSAGGLEVQFQRGASYFAYTDTTKVPGFATQFHRLISMMAALDFCQINSMPERVAVLEGMIGAPPDLMNNQPGSGMVKELVDFYSSRDADSKITLVPRRTDYGELALNPGSGTFPNGSPWSNPEGF